MAALSRIPHPTGLADTEGWAGFFAFALGLSIIPFGSTITVLYFVGCGIALIGLLLGKLRLSADLMWSFPVFAVLAFFAVELASPLFFSNAAKGWFQVGGALHFLLFPLLLAGFMAARREDLFALFINGLRVGVIAGCFIALVQAFVFGFTRAEAAMGNAIPYANLSLLGGFLSLLQLRRAGNGERFLALAAVLCGVGGYLLSGTRGAIVATPFLILALIIAYWPVLRDNARLRWAVLVTGAATVIVIGLLALTAPRFQQFATAIGKENLLLVKEKSIAYRAVMLTYGWEAVQDRPVFGYGTQNRVDEVYSRANAAGVTMLRYQHLHNDVINALVGKGMLGLATLVLIYLLPFAHAWRRKPGGVNRELVAAGVMLSASYMLFGLTNALFGHDLMNSFYLGFCAVLIASAAKPGLSPSK